MHRLFFNSAYWIHHLDVIVQRSFEQRASRVVSQGGEERKQGRAVSQAQLGWEFGEDEQIQTWLVWEKALTIWEQSIKLNSINF